MEDREIIALFEARSEQAIEELDQKHGRFVSQVALNILHDARDAEEAVNDTYLAAWNTIPPQKPDPLRTYVCRIARNLAVAKLRSNTAGKRNGSYYAVLDELGEVLPAAETVESAYAAAELTAAIDRFLDAVSYDDRYMFIKRKLNLWNRMTFGSSSQPFAVTDMKRFIRSPFLLASGRAKSLA